jgi:hypothetical protein
MSRPGVRSQPEDLQEGFQVRWERMEDDAPALMILAWAARPRWPQGPA